MQEFQKWLAGSNKNAEAIRKRTGLLRRLFELMDRRLRFSPHHVFDPRSPDHFRLPHGMRDIFQEAEATSGPHSATNMAHAWHTFINFTISVHVDYRKSLPIGDSEARHVHATLASELLGDLSLATELTSQLAARSRVATEENKREKRKQGTSWEYQPHGLLQLLRRFEESQALERDEANLLRLLPSTTADFRPVSSVRIREVCHDDDDGLQLAA